MRRLLLLVALAGCASPRQAPLTTPRLVIRGAQDIARLTFDVRRIDNGRAVRVASGDELERLCSPCEGLTLDLALTGDPEGELVLVVLGFGEVGGAADKRAIAPLPSSSGEMIVTLEPLDCTDGDGDGFCADDPAGATWTDCKDDAPEATPLFGCEDEDPPAEDVAQPDVVEVDSPEDVAAPELPEDVPDVAPDVDEDAAEDAADTAPCPQECVAGDTKCVGALIATCVSAGDGACATWSAEVACDDADPATCRYSVCQTKSCEVVTAEGTCFIEGVCHDAFADGPECKKCLPALSAEAWSNAPDGTTCKGPACLVNGKCSLGSCSLGDVMSCNDNNPCTTDECDGDGGCIHGAAEGSCNDNAACTTGDHCEDMLCVGEEHPCLEDAFACTADACDGEGGCDHAILKDFCLIAGQCIVAGGKHPEDPCYVCAPNASTTDWSPAEAGTACASDDVVCTLDECDGGTCLHTIFPDTCYVDGFCVTDGTAHPGSECQTCDAAASQTAWTPKSADTLCTPDDEQCTEDRCNGGGACAHTPATDGTACDDGGFCTDFDTCQSGACASGTPHDCEDGFVCTEDVCDEVLLACTSAPLSCDDGLSCTSDTCETGAGCKHVTALEGSACDDADACTTGSTCSGTKCNGGTAVECSDGNLCTADACKPATGCTYPKLDGTPCEDGNPCTADDACASGSCAGPGRSCNDGDGCTTDFCAIETGGCVHEPIVNCCSVGSDCKGPGCTQGACSDGHCYYVGFPSSCYGCNSDADCNDGDGCTVDGCKSAYCVHTPKTCDDGLGCTTESCSGGSCKYTIADGQCAIDGVCRDDGATHDASSCLACQSGVSKTAWTLLATGSACASDGLECTADTCTAGGVCAHVPMAQQCAIDGACYAEGDPDPSNPCRECGPKDSAVAFTDRPAGTACPDDGNNCTADECDGLGACAHADIADCP